MPHLFRVIVPVSDIERATLFYGALLGAAGSRVSPGRHYFEYEGTILACYDPQADGDGRNAKPLPEPIDFAVDDLESVYASAETAGRRSHVLSIPVRAPSDGSREDPGESDRSMRQIHSVIRCASLVEARFLPARPMIEHEKSGPCTSSARDTLRHDGMISGVHVPKNTPGRMNP
jgi:catechol 2,3-dioxygenase-like lactoylglutathione lyase family enzyme